MRPPARFLGCPKLQCGQTRTILTRRNLCAHLRPFINGLNEPLLEKDVALLRDIGGGDSAAFAHFYDQYSKLLFSIAYKILNDAKEAEDVLQEVFLQIWDKAGNYDSKLGRPVSWAITLTRNKAIDHIRSSRRRAKLMAEASTEMAARSGGGVTANESHRGREAADLISQAVAKLPEEQRKAIELAFFSGLTQDEISENLKEPLGTIKARIRRGMMKLRDRLEGVA